MALWGAAPFLVKPQTWRGAALGPWDGPSLAQRTFLEPMLSARLVGGAGEAGGADAHPREAHRRGSYRGWVIPLLPTYTPAEEPLGVRGPRERRPLSWVSLHLPRGNNVPKSPWNEQEF